MPTRWNFFGPPGHVAEINTSASPSITASSAPTYQALVGRDVVLQHACRHSFFWFGRKPAQHLSRLSSCLHVRERRHTWFERFIIIVAGLHRDFLPSSWGMFDPTWVDNWTFIGTFGIFLSLFLLFIRFLPMIAMSEVKIVLPEVNVPSRHALEEHHVVAVRGAGAHMITPRGNHVFTGWRPSISSASALYEAAKQGTPDAGYERWDVHSPFPIHGMDEAMGLGKSWPPKCRSCFAAVFSLGF